MTSSYLERELKLAVEPNFVIPDVSRLLPEGGRTEMATEHLRSDYFDTSDHALLRARMTLRRRTGTTDTGWQLKIPAEPFREEIRVDPDGDGVPEELRRLLQGVLRGHSLLQIASLTTERSVTRLLNATGQKLAEIDDDTVHASAAGDGAAIVSSWREVEVELGEAAPDVDLLHALGKRLRRAGASPAQGSSKLARALSEEGPARSSATQGGKRRRLSAGDVIADYIAEQQRVILAGDLALRRGDYSIIHKTRVATRRLRSTLRVFGVLIDSDRAATLDGELRWYAALLGDVRDRQVLQDRLDRMIGEVDDALLLGPVRTRIDTELRRELTEHWHSLQEEITQQRYLALLADIDGWVQQPPHGPDADQPAKSIAKLVRNAEGKVSRRLRDANTSGDIHKLHDARKAAKRARYAAEAAEPVIGPKVASDHAKRYQKLQDLLGEHQDSIVSAELLRRLGAKAGTTEGENGFAFGILHEREEHNARVARDKARKTAKRYT